VSARAEIIRWMLPQPSRFFVVAELAAHAAYGKDNVADALDMFSRAGVVTQTTMTTAGNQKRFRLDAGAELVALAGPAIPNPDWAAMFRLLLALVAFASTAPGDEAARALETSLAAQRSDGSWNYAEGQHGDWVDNFHTGYVLECLAEHRRRRLRIAQCRVDGLDLDLQRLHQEGYDIVAAVRQAVGPQVEILIDTKGLRIFSGLSADADIETTDDMMRLHAFKIEQKEAGSASLAAGDTMPLSPIKEFAAPQRLPLFRHSPCWSELGFCR